MKRDQDILMTARLCGMSAIDIEYIAKRFAALNAAQPPCGTDGASRARDLLKIFGYDHYTPHMVCIPADKWAEAMALLGSKMIEQKEAQGSVYMPGCPVCGNPEIDSATARTVYSCGSSDYDQRPGTFKQSRDCTLISAQSALAASQREGGGT